jgi:hypothetical protein
VSEKYQELTPPYHIYVRSIVRHKGGGRYFYLTHIVKNYKFIYFILKQVQQNKYIGEIILANEELGSVVVPEGYQLYKRKVIQKGKNTKLVFFSPVLSSNYRFAVIKLKQIEENRYNVEIELRSNG